MRAQRDEALAMKSIFLTLYPVNWRQSLRRLNKYIEEEVRGTRNTHNDVSQHEYWKFIGLLLLCAVQQSGGVEGIFDTKETEGIVTKIPAQKFMSRSRFMFIKKHWVSQFQLELDEANKNQNKWWRVGYLVNGFNMNRRETIASSRVKTLDESMSAFKPQTTKTGNLPNISYIMRKPEPLGTELKTVASVESNGPMIYAEIQEGKLGMRNKPFFNSYGATCACTLRLAKGTLDAGQKTDPSTRNLFFDDSWFASLKTAVAVYEVVNAEFCGPIKTAHAKFPKAYLELTMADWVPGSHLVLETTVKGNKYYAIGYKYNMKKVLCFVCTENAGSTEPGEPYEAKWTDNNGNPASRLIPRPSVLSHYFNYSNQIDKHNHARQFELAIEKHVVTKCGYFRLFTTYLGITVTDAWKCYRASLGDGCKNKHISILSFANILCKSFLSNNFRRHTDRNLPQRTNRVLSTQDPQSRRNLDIPEEIAATTNRSLSTLGSSGAPNGLICIGNGKYIPSSYECFHQTATCILTEEYVNVEKGSYGKKRRKRRKCICRKNTRWLCSVCGIAVCSLEKSCFFLHKHDKVGKEREAYWLSIQP